MKKANSKKILSFITLLLVITSGCEEVELGNDFLAKEPSGADVTNKEIFGSLLLANRYLTTGYATLPYGLINGQGGRGGKVGTDYLEALTDLSHSFMTWSGVNTMYYSGQYGPGVESDSPHSTKYSFTSESSWEGIRIALNFIDNVDKIPIDAATLAQDPNIKKRLAAEAKMIIALHYCEMYRHFGGLPWVDRIYMASEIPTLPRLTSLETLRKIISLLDAAKPDLPLIIANPAVDDGRFTKAAAMGLKARLLLFAASPLFNSAVPYYPESKSLAIKQKLAWHGGYDINLWKEAADAAKELLDAGSYQLVKTGNTRQDFQDAYYKRNNGEVLVSTRIKLRNLNYWNDGEYLYAGAVNYGLANPTKQYVDMFPMSNGKEITDKDSGYNPALPWENRDPRLYESVLINGDKFQNRTVELFPGGIETLSGRTNVRTGFKMRKFIWDTSGPGSPVLGTTVHWPYLRLAEIYLTYAEALNEFNGSPTQEAIDAVNLVRARVGLDGLSNDQIASKDSFRNAILKERACEFGFEEVRWFDIVRYKMHNVFTKKLQGHIIATANAARTAFTYEEPFLPARSWSKDPEAEFKWYLSAFPVTEINKGYGLIQNPGY